LTPAPLPVTIAELTFVPRSEADGPGFENYRQQVRRSLAANWFPLLVVYAVAMAMAVYVTRRERSRGNPSAVAWGILVFLLGPAGLLGYWLHRIWPARQRCPHCGKLAPCDRSSCLACQRPIPEPARIGIEVFA
jgi:hypothetical protein